MKSYNPWSMDQQNSIAAIYNNKRHIIDALGGGEIYLIEGSNIKILQILDRDCGIDLIWKKNKKARGIASRVQWMGWRGESYDTFTIRSERESKTETEYKKRIETIGESFYPHLTMQMYCNNRKENILETMAIIKTEDLYLLSIECPELFHTTKSNNFFKFISWKNIRNKPDTNILIKRRGKELEGELRLN